MTHNDPKARHDFLYLFEVTNGNPNGDPDAANAPRMDPETNRGLVTDVSLKRKVRDFVATTKQGRIFIQSQIALNQSIEEVGGASIDSKEWNDKKPDERARKAMCQAFYDVRMFGAVMSTGKLNAGQVRGPLQLTFARSLDPILPLDLAITRQARTKVASLETGGTEMGRKPIVPYGLYMAKGHYNPYLGQDTGVTEHDLKLFWDALARMFEFDRSAARGEMAARGLWVFTHETPLGNHPSHKLFDLVQVRKREEVDAPRAFTDYQVKVGQPPAGVRMLELLGCETGQETAPVTLLAGRP